MEEDEITFSGELKDQPAIKVSNIKDADFLVALSALSSYASTTTTDTQALDIVMVLDASGSMKDTMSGGTKRIDALKNAVILDEATSSVDTRTEALIEKGMDQLMEGRTVFVIAHRLGTVRNSNAIMVLEQGKIVERGDHDDLLEQKGKYYQLYHGMFELS